MVRLNKTAWEILRTELNKLGGNDSMSIIERELVIKRLSDMRKEAGDSATYEEIKEVIVDIFPNFSAKVIHAAARANRKLGIISKLKWGTILLVSTSGFLWFVNLPYPMIRWPVSKTAPLLLLPSFFSMDYDYRGAIDSLEQADQLITRSTSPADIAKGSEKVKEAKNHLDHLPVWFLGYYPQGYCTLFGCTWKFTIDEFEAARHHVARLDATAFQDRNALSPLNEGVNNLVAAKQQYEKATSLSEKERAIAIWQAEIDKLTEISSQTFAGKAAQTKLLAYRRDFEDAKISTFIAAAEGFDAEAEKIKTTQAQTASELWRQAIDRLNQVPIDNPHYLEAQTLMAAYQIKQKTPTDAYSSTFIEASKQYAMSAAKASQNPPHTAGEWEQISKLWSQAIAQLENIKVAEPGYVEAQRLLAEYQTNLGIIENRRQLEIESQRIYTEANEQIQRLITNPPTDKNQVSGELRGIINQLNNVKPGTTAYADAQALIKSANNQLQQIH